MEQATQQEVSLPVIEAVMINVRGNQEILFVSPRQVIKSRANSQ